MDPLIPQPDPEQIKAARLAAGLTQLQAANLVGSASFQTWNYWESGKRSIPADSWALFMLATDQHPALRLAKRKPINQHCQPRIVREVDK